MGGQQRQPSWRYTITCAPLLLQDAAEYTCMQDDEAEGYTRMQDDGRPTTPGPHIAAIITHLHAATWARIHCSVNPRTPSALVLRGSQWSGYLHAIITPCSTGSYLRPTRCLQPACHACVTSRGQEQRWTPQQGQAARPTHASGKLTGGSCKSRRRRRSAQSRSRRGGRSSRLGWRTAGLHRGGGGGSKPVHRGAMRLGPRHAAGQQCRRAVAAVLSAPQPLAGRPSGTAGTC